MTDLTQPVAWKYRWKIDGEYVGWRYSDASNAHPSLDGFEEIPLYDADSIGALIPSADADKAELVTLRAQVERLTGALTIAANRLHRCSVDYDTGTREFIEVGGWADEARAALTEGAAP